MRHWRPLYELFLARLREFYREPLVLFWVYGFPLFLAIGLGIAFSSDRPAPPTIDIESEAATVGPTGRESQAQALKATLAEAGFRVSVAPAEECRRRLRAGKTVLFIVPTAAGYEYHYDPTRAEGVQARFQADDAIVRRRAGTAAGTASDVLVIEPGSRYIDFLIPGLMGLNLMNGGLWGVGFVIVDMRVRKLLKRLLATPMRRSDFLLSILGSRLIFVVPEMLVLLLVGRFGFGMPIRGNPLALALVIFLGGAGFASIGLLLACRTEKTETISGLINLLVLPMWMLSGTFFSAQRFPDAMQPLIRALPLTQLNEALRAILLEGAPLRAVAWQVAALAGWTILPFVLALRWFRWH